MVLATTSRLLIELVRCGLVVKIPGGYELNRDHLAYQALGVLLGARDELQRRVEHDVAGWETRPLSVVLFGSAARQHHTDDPLIASLLREGITLVGAKLGDFALRSLAAARRPGGDAAHTVPLYVPTSPCCTALRGSRVVVLGAGAASAAHSVPPRDPTSPRCTAPCRRLRRAVRGRRRRW